MDDAPMCCVEEAMNIWISTSHLRMQVAARAWLGYAWDAAVACRGRGGKGVARACLDAPAWRRSLEELIRAGGHEVVLGVPERPEVRVTRRAADGQRRGGQAFRTVACACTGRMGLN